MRSESLPWSVRDGRGRPLPVVSRHGPPMELLVVPFNDLCCVLCSASQEACCRDCGRCCVHPCDLFCSFRWLDILRCERCCDDGSDTVERRPSWLRRRTLSRHESVHLPDLVPMGAPWHGRACGEGEVDGHAVNAWPPHSAYGIAAWEVEYSALPPRAPRSSLGASDGTH